MPAQTPASPKPLDPRQILRRREEERLRAERADSIAQSLRAAMRMAGLAHLPDDASAWGRNVAFGALEANAAGDLSGPILQQIWGFALAASPDSDLAFSILAGRLGWQQPNSLTQPAILALGVGIALERGASQPSLFAKLRKLRESGADLDAARAWAKDSLDESPRIMGMDWAFRELEAFALNEAASVAPPIADGDLANASATVPCRAPRRI